METKMLGNMPHENTTWLSFINYFNTYTLVYWKISGITLISNLTRNLLSASHRGKRQLPNYILKRHKTLLHIIIPTLPQKTKMKTLELFLWKLMNVHSVL